MALRARLTPPREFQTDWPWHKVKSSSIRASLLFSAGRRMEAENFLASGFGTRLAMESKQGGWTQLQEIARTWQPSRLKGIQVNAEFGTPFLAATQVYDVRPIPRKWLSLNRTSDHAERFISHGTILVTCSGSVGRAMLAHATTDGVLVSHDLLRVDAKQNDWRGWIYSYLRAPTVREMMKAARYGHIIKHLETHHLDSLPILRLRKELRAAFETRAKEIIEFRDRAHRLVNQAEADYAQAIGEPPDLGDGSLGFAARASAMFGRGRRLEGHYHNPRARAAEHAVRSGGRRIEILRTLVESVFVPGRFKHVYGDDGVPYLDSAQILEVAPDIEKRVLSLKGEKQAGYLVDAGALLLPCSGQLHGIIGSVVLATTWHENKVLTNHVLRILPKAKAQIRVGYLQQVLSHPVLGRPRVLKGAFGSSVPELSPEDICDLSVPRLQTSVEDKVADAMEEAAKLRARADELEEEVATEADDHVSRFLAGERHHIES
ncbi:MAG: hypothetical protein J0H17_15325 [Rhizobiales bacterium]|nr:hypothetical protein [Hyphomicrobiales bacterium]